MSEQDKPDPWALLASELGVESHPKAVKKEEPPASAESESASIVSKAKPAPTPRAPSTEPRKSPQDWLRLASDLGVDVSEEAFRPQTPVPPVEKAPLDEPPRESWAPVEDEILAEVIEEPTETEPEDADRWQDEVEVVETHAERAERGEKKLRKRRKRRRRGRRPEGLTGAEEPTEGPGHPIESAELVEMVELVEEAEDEVVEPTAAELGEPGTEEEAPKRPKRRRRRRSGRKKSAGAAEEQEDVAETLQQKPEEEPVPESDQLEELDEEDDEEDDEALETREPGQRKRDKLKAIHRGIPSWREAIDVVISTNLESRAKHPEKNSYPRSRGGRNRNGRDKSS